MDRKAALASEVGVDDEYSNPAVEEVPTVQDIDPRQWLTSDDSAVVGYVTTRAGRLKIAALTESETDRVRKGAEKPINPAKPHLGKRVDLKLLRTLTACASLNKAYAGTQGFIAMMPSELEAKLAGEITAIVNEIAKLSGYSEEEEESLPTFLQLS